MRAALKSHKWDLVVSDYSIPGFGGRAALELFQRENLSIPFLVVSGVIGEARAVEMVKAGAHDYVMKNDLARLVPAVRRELRAAQERQVREQAEASAAYVASLVESCDDAIIGMTLDSTLLSWNAGAERLFGHTSAEAVGQSAAILVPHYRPEDFSEILKRIQKGGPVESCETVQLRKDGTTIEVLLTVSPVKTPEGRVNGASIMAHDISQRKLEENDHVALIQELTAALTHTDKGRVQSPERR